MPVRIPYRFNRIVPMLIGLLFFFFASSPLQAQEDQVDTLIEVAEPPVQAFDKDDDYNTASQALPPELRKVPDSTVRRLKRDKAFAYANDDALLEKEEQREERQTSTWDGAYRFFSSDAVRVLMYVLLGLFLIFVIYRIIVVNNLYFIPSRKKLVHDDDGGEENISDENIDVKIRNAAAAGDFRTAIRYSYLKGLRLLNDKGWIRMHAQATNHDYLYQVSKYPVAGDFNFLTRVYDYVWYGEFVVNDEQYARLQTEFQKFYLAIK
jgi:hypothetical protein